MLLMEPFNWSCSHSRLFPYKFLLALSVINFAVVFAVSLTPGLASTVVVLLAVVEDVMITEP